MYALGWETPASDPAAAARAAGNRVRDAEPDKFIFMGGVFQYMGSGEAEREHSAQMQANMEGSP